TPHFRDPVFEAVREIDAGSMLRPRHRIADRLSRPFGTPRDAHAARALLPAPLEGNGLVQRLQLVRCHGAVHPPHRGHILGVLALNYFPQRLALLGVGALVDDYLHCAIALMNCTRPAHDQSGAKAIQTDISIMALVDLIPHDRPAIAVRGQRIELSWAAIRAVAVGELAPFYLPG